MLVMQADTVAVDSSDPEVTVIDFAENDPVTGVVQHYLILERTHEFDQQDVRLGMADVYVELDSQSRACYGGIQRFTLHRDHVQVILDETAARHLGDVEVIEVRFDAGPSQFHELRDGLRLVFKGFDCYEDLSLGVPV
jgi:hypothetical protein